MFSIVIPLYNKAPYIEKALRFVQAQTCREFEVIIIDDGSTDNSLDLANKFIAEISSSPTTSPPLGGFRGASQSNQGVSTARNNGVKLAKYPYICFLDADDWWAPTFLEEMKGLIEEFPDAGIYGTSYYKVKNGKHIPANIGVEEDFQKGYINYCQVYAKTMWMPLTSISVCIPKKVFEEENGFKPNLKLGEDFDLWVRIALKYPVAFLNKPLAYYNQDVDVKNKGVMKDKIYDPKTFVTFHLDFLKDDEEKNADLKLLLDKLRVSSLYRYRLQNKYPDEVNKIISKVDFSNLSRKNYYHYHLPVFLLNIVYSIQKLGSRIKTYYYYVNKIFKKSIK